MKTCLANVVRIAAVPLLAVLSACSHHARHGGLPPVRTYAVADALAVGDGSLLSPGNFATAYFAPAPSGSPGAAATLNGNGQVVYAPDGSLYRYNNGPGGCAISKYAFGAIGPAAPTATATGDPNLLGTTSPLGCWSGATDPSGNLYVLVANGPYLGVDVFDAQLVFQRQLGNGPTSGIVANGRIPAMPLTIDPGQNLYVGQGTTISVFNANDFGDAPPVSQFPLTSAAIALLADASGNLYVGSASSVSFIPAGATVPSTVLNLPTNSLVPSQSLQIASSNSLALDSQNNLYVLTVGGSAGTSQVLRYGASSTGNASFAASIPLDPNAKSIAVAPHVP